MRRLTLASGAVAVVAGTGTQGDSGEGGPAVSARLNTPLGLGLDKDGLLLIADSLNFKVKRVGANVATSRRLRGMGNRHRRGMAGLRRSHHWRNRRMCLGRRMGASTFPTYGTEGSGL